MAPSNSKKPLPTWNQPIRLFSRSRLQVNAAKDEGGFILVDNREIIRAASRDVQRPTHK
jgi:hypothetical protein